MSEQAPGTHKHKCFFCGFVWRHEDSLDRQHGSEGFHECARCGRCNWSLGIYEGEEEPSEADSVHRDTPGRTDHDFVCGNDFPAGEGTRATGRRAHLSGTYRNLDITYQSHDLGVHGNGVKFVKGKRYRVIIQEIP